MKIYFIEGHFFTASLIRTISIRGHEFHAEVRKETANAELKAMTQPVTFKGQEGWV